jgi:hypothetical protein
VGHGRTHATPSETECTTPALLSEGMRSGSGQTVDQPLGISLYVALPAEWHPGLIVELDEQRSVSSASTSVAKADKSVKVCGDCAVVSALQHVPRGMCTSASYIRTVRQRGDAICIAVSLPVARVRSIHRHAREFPDGDKAVLAQCWTEVDPSS